MHNKVQHMDAQDAPVSVDAKRSSCPVKSDIEAKIEYQEIVGEAKPGTYQPIRFTRVKYKASPETHIDIRRFQRG